jgi:hypothetical protein
MPQSFDEPEGEPIDSESPVLRVGLAGFNESQCKDIFLALANPLANEPIWKISPFQLADAWLLCGENSTPANTASQDTLRIAAGLQHDRTLTLNLSEIDRPVAFSLPLASAEIEARLTFDVRSTPSLRAVLGAFEQWLRPLRAKFLLGAQLMARESQLKRVIYHVSCNGQLLAVLDFAGWKIGLLPEATPEQFSGALWETRPSQAHAIPSHFVLSSVEQLRWIFAQHTARNVLPKRYQRQVIYFARTPSVPQTWLQPAHLLLLRELSSRPGTLKELVDRTAIAPEEVARDLACLYFSGSLTTTPDKAASKAFSRTNSLANGSEEVPSPKGSRKPRAETTIFNSTLPPDTEMLLEHDHTAPAGLQRE